jgi:hypothetical protein
MAENSRAALYLSQKVLQVQIVKLYFLQDLDLCIGAIYVTAIFSKNKGFMALYAKHHPRS